MAEPQFRVLTLNGEPVKTIEAGGNYVVNFTVDKGTENEGKFLYRSVQALQFEDRTQTVVISRMSAQFPADTVSTDPLRF